MINHVTISARGAVLAMVAVLCYTPSALAIKPDNPGGGNGNSGGNGGGKTAPLYFVDLHPAGAFESYAFGMNDSGMVVGSADIGPGYWDLTQASPEFQPIPGKGLQAIDVNSAGQIIGQGSFAGPVFWPDKDSLPIPLTLPKGAVTADIAAISDSGLIIGNVNILSVDYGVAWLVTGGSTVSSPQLIGPGVVHDVVAVDGLINRVVGSSPEKAFGYLATAWDLQLQMDGTFSLLGNEFLVPDQTSEAFAITDSGDVAGIVRFIDGNGPKVPSKSSDAAFVIRDGQTELLPSGGNNQYGLGYALNETTVVGVTAPTRLSSEVVPTLWEDKGRPIDLLNSYFDDSWIGAEARAINSKGQISGFGVTDKTVHAWALRVTPSKVVAGTSVPEPSAAALAATILLLITRARRRGENRGQAGNKRRQCTLAR